MSFDARALYSLLPAILRIRDQSQAVFTPGLLEAAARQLYADLQAKASGGTITPAEQATLDSLTQSALAGPLASLLAMFAETFAALEEDLAQLYDDQFIETCAPWVVPYIGDLIGYRTLSGQISAVSSPRAEVAQTIAFRRRKGTVVVLEKLARDVTGWNATAVEFFQKLVMTQYMNHIRPQCAATPDLRRWEPLERVGGAFDPVMRTIDVRRINSGRGKYNIPNVGLFLWSIDAYQLTHSPAARLDDRRFRFHPLGVDQPLYAKPREIPEFTRLSSPVNVPAPISRRALDAEVRRAQTPPNHAPAEWVTGSFRLYAGNGGTVSPVGWDAIRICNLDDAGTAWAHMPTDNQALYVIDPWLGRIALSPGVPAGTRIYADFHYGFSGNLGGGEYDRSAEVADEQVPPNLLRVPETYPTISAAIAALGPDGGVVEITDSGRYEETPAIKAPAGKTIQLRAADGHRPTIVLGGEFALGGNAGGGIVLSGLLISGNALRVKNGEGLGSLQVRHCTLVPGWALDPACAPQHPGEASLVIETTDLALTITRSILGSLHVHHKSAVSASDSIINATAKPGQEDPDSAAVAYAAEDGATAGAPLQMENCTVIGKVHALKLPLVSNCIILADLAKSDVWAAPVIAERRQEGCIRFSYLPETARVPRRYRCLPESAASPDQAIPHFTSLRYGFPAYAQLARTPSASLTGADNEGQMGAFNFLFQPQREANLRIRLDEYLRAGLEAGIFYAS